MQESSYQTDTQGRKGQRTRELLEIGAESDLDSNRILYKRDVADVARGYPLYGIPSLYVGRNVAYEGSRCIFTSERRRRDEKRRRGEERRGNARYTFRSYRLKDQVQ